MRYLDHAASTPTRPEVWAAMEPLVLDSFGNPSGSHAVSRRAKNALEAARESAAGLLGCAPTEVVFTGGGTESDNLAVKGAALAGSGGVVTVATEHEAVLESARFLARMGRDVTVLDVDATGRVDPAAVGHAAEGASVVSVMTANNETGTLQPIREIVEAVDGRAPVHTDAVQAFVSVPLDVRELGVDLLTLAGHKFGGPKGTGLLYVREGTALEPLLHGGGQELGRRSGTHDVAGAVGLVAAMEAAVEDRGRFVEEVTAIRERFEGLLEGVANRTVPRELTLVQHSHLRIPGIHNETALIRLDRAGVAASAASACQSGATTVSHVLTAMGLTAREARECLRFSFGWSSTAADAEVAAEALRTLAGAAA